MKHQIFWLALSLFILITSLVLRLSEPYSINVDGAFHLQCAQQILSGHLPYVGVFDNNPPLSMYLHMIPCLVANLSGLHVVTSFNVVTWIVAVFSLLWCARILFRHASSLSHVDWGLLLVAISLITFTIGADYGQREHLFVSCAVPLLLLRWMRWDAEPFLIGRVESFALGLFASLALLLKPHFLLPLIAAEITWMVLCRRVRPILAPEFGGCLVGGLLYLAHFAFLPASVQNSFFHDIVPLVVHGYGAYDCKTSELLQMSLPAFYGGIFYGIPFFIPTFTLVLFAIAYLLRDRCKFILPLAAFTFGGYLVFVLQHKGWSNHTIPMLTGCFLLASLELAVLVNFKRLNWQFLASACAVPFVFILLIAVGCRNEAPLYEDPELLKDLTTYTQAGDKVLVLATVLHPAYPLLTQLDRQPGSRYLHLFHLPMLEYWKAHTQDAQEKSRLEDEERQVLDNLEKDIDVNKPKLIAIETKPLERGDCNFNISSYLDEHGFRERSLKNYHFVRDSGIYLLYGL